MNVKSMKTPNGKYYGNLVYSPDENGFYVEIWKDKEPGEIQTGLHDTEQAA